MIQPLRQRVRCLLRVIRKNRDAGRRTTVLVVGTRIVALHPADPLVQDLQKRDGAVVVGTFPLVGVFIAEAPLPDEDQLYAALDDMLDVVDDIKRRGEAVKKSEAGRLLGSSSPRATMNEGLCKALRHAHDDLQVGYKALAIISGMPKTTVEDVCKRRTWPHVR